MMAAFQYESLLRRLGAGPVRCIETPEYRREHYDFELHVHERWTSVIEIKSRVVTSRQIEEWGTIVVEVERLTELRKQFLSKSEITGKTFWTKEVIFVFRCTKDDTCFAVNIREIVKHWDDLEDAPPEMLKLDHGEGLKDCSGKLVPISLMERFT